MKIEIMDTTLRDGEQTSGVSFAGQEKLSVVRLLLDELKVDRVEIASARVSAGEFESVRRIGIWARRYNMLDRIEILGFIDKGQSLKWVKDAGMKVINLLTKGSLNHVTNQLRKSPEQHLADVRAEVAMCQEAGGDDLVRIHIFDG